MPFIVPNTPDVVDINQAEPEAFDFEVLGDRRTGLISGGLVSALGTVGPAVQVTAGKAIINGVPVAFNGSQVSVAVGTSSPRTDIIAVNATGGLVNIQGSASQNTRAADFDPTTHCPLASVFIPAGQSVVLSGHVTTKSPDMPDTWKRVYESDTTDVINLTSPAGGVNVRSDGQHTWGFSTLRRLTANSMEWATSVLLKAVDDSLSVLILKARPTNPDTQKLLQAQSTGGSEVAYLDGIGRVFADNFKWGSGSPEGVVTARRGTLYSDIANAGTSTGMWQKGGADLSNTGWVSFKVYNPADSALPTGTLINSLSASPPTGFIACVGQWIPTTGATAALAAVIGSRYGSQSGQVLMPNLTNCTLVQYGNEVGLGGQVGSPTTTLSIANLPAHAHDVWDPGHEHPQPGPYWYYMPPAYHNNMHPWHTNESAPHLYPEPGNFSHHAWTGIVIGNTGSNAAFSNMQPSHGVAIYAKL